MNLKFNNSLNSTVGIELEMRILDSETYNVKNCSEIIFNNIDSSLKPQIHKELLKSMFEIVTPVCNTIDEAVEFIDNIIKEVGLIGKEHNFLIAALATHPYEKKEDSEIYEDPRYESFKEEFQIILRNFLISGLHIHAGVNSEENAIKAYNSVINYIPLFLALSANSPFFHNEDTGLKSYRTKVFDKLPRAGIPEYFDTYEEYKGIYEDLYNTGTIKKAKDVWWDVRISPEFGTLELRVCDAFYDKKKLRFLGMFYQSIVEYAKIVEPKRQYHQINMQNKWNATRHGLDGEFIEDGIKTGIRDKIRELFKEMKDAGIFEKLNISEQMEELKYTIEEKSPSCKLKDIYADTKDFNKVIQSQII